MAEFTSIEMIKIEKILEMESGYVLDFSNKTFQNFIYEHTNKDIYNDFYSDNGNSKANRLRSFINKENNILVSRLLSALLEYWKVKKMQSEDEIDFQQHNLYESCISICKKLKDKNLEESITELESISLTDSNSALLLDDIKASIENGNPQLALDRLHTFTVKYIKKLCIKLGIKTENKPLHGLYGEYVRYLKDENYIESEMTIKIVRSSITILEQFNHVRNQRSFAHDNDILNTNESMYIYKSVSNLISFLIQIEKEVDKQLIHLKQEKEWEFPF
ncbi:abortive infection family protein [Bacillus amyloliquefaciens]|uniref:abortive infection family protein n=1 Tax=Bacillus amyloliquefaciens TaxID=1390 RepID=UPI002D7EF6B9|nr:abortive infection family protein [Bacillus amyloliquefaciens]MEB4593923.1 abortive infection family protein [Bacillus amyloliquefaciens]